MSNIKVAIAGRDIKVADGYEKPSAGDVNTCLVSFTIEGGVLLELPNKRVTFYSRAGSVTLDYADELQIPWEVLVNAGALYLTLTGYDPNGNEVARTHSMIYPIEIAKAGLDEGTEPTQPTLDVVSRIDNLASTLEQSETTRQEAFESAQDERSSSFQASMSEWQQDVAESVSHASDAATLANEAATNANNATSNANDATENANKAAEDIRAAAERGDFDGAPGEPGADGYSPTANVTKDGGTATITVTDKNGTTTATVSDGAPGSDASATDVRINGTSITADGVANILATKGNSNNSTENSYGVVKSRGQAYGIWVEPGGLICTNAVNKSDIDARDNYFKPIASALLDYAVKAAMCDGKGAAWTDNEQQAARERMNAADAEKVYIMQKQIENLQGIAATEETDSTEAYTKTVPIGAQKWASLDKVGGKTIVWNQLAPDPATYFAEAGISYTNNGEEYIMTCSTTANNGVYFENANFSNGHKYLFAIDVKTTAEYIVAFKPSGANIKGISESVVGDSYETLSNISTATGDLKNVRVYIYCISWDGNTTTFKNPCIFDLTQMFGAGNEPSTVEEFRAMFPADHYPYNPGELMSAEVVEVESKGKNLCNISDVECTDGMVNMPFTLPAGAYKVSCDVSKKTGELPMYIGVLSGIVITAQMTESDGRYVGTLNLSEPVTQIYFYPNGGYNDSKGHKAKFSNIQIERGTIATPYSPYGIKGTFQIPAEVREMCPGYGWSAGTVCNEIDFGRKVYVQRVGSVDLGTLAWNYNDTGFFHSRNLAPQSAGWWGISSMPNIVCGKFSRMTWNEILESTNNNCASTFENQVRISCSSYTSVESFKSAMQGVILYYELAEPIEVDLSNVLPDDHFIEVEAGGTVTFKQAGTQLPVPSSVTYQISTKEVVANA